MNLLIIIGLNKVILLVTMFFSDILLALLYLLKKIIKKIPQIIFLTQKNQSM